MLKYFSPNFLAALALILIAAFTGAVLLHAFYG